MNKYEEAYQNGYGAVVKTITKLAAAAGGQEKTASDYPFGTVQNAAANLGGEGDYQACRRCRRAGEDGK